MKKEEFEQKIQSAQPSVKAEKAYAKTKQTKLGKVFRAIKVGVITFAMAAAMAFNAMAMAACEPKPTPPTPDPPKPPITVPVDKEKEALAKGTALFEAELDKIETNKNFTYNDGSKTYFVDGDTLKIGEDYIVKENGTLYKISKQEDGKYHKQLTEEVDASQVLSALLDKVDDLTFTKYDEATKTLTANGITIKVDNGLTIKIGDKTHTVTDIDNTKLQLPTEIVDDTKPPELTEEEKQAIIVQNIYNAVESILGTPSALGHNAKINDVLAVDYEDGGDKVTLLVDNTTSTRRISLLTFTTTTKTTKENILNNIISIDISIDAEKPFSVGYTVFDTKNNEKSNAIYNKLKQENLLESKVEANIKAYSTGSGGIDEVLGGCNSITLYTLNNNEIEKIEMRAKSDGNITDFVTESLINGTLNKTFKPFTSSSSHYYFEFSDNAIVNYEGLPFEKQEEESKTTSTISARVMVGDQLFAIKLGNQTIYFDLYNEENSEY